MHLNNLIREFAPTASRMSMQNLLCRDDNEPCIQEFSIENLVEQAVSIMDESDDGKSAHAASDADEDCYIKPPSIEEQVKALSITKWIIQDGHYADKAAIRGGAFANSFETPEECFYKKRRITEFFNNKMKQYLSEVRMASIPPSCKP